MQTFLVPRREPVWSILLQIIFARLAAASILSATFFQSQPPSIGWILDA